MGWPSGLRRRFAKPLRVKTPRAGSNPVPTAYGFLLSYDSAGNLRMIFQPITTIINSLKKFTPSPRNKRILGIFLILLIFVLFFLKAHVFLDPDFGWHISEGQLEIKQGILKTDPFSYTMPSFPFIDYEWLNSILLAKIYPLILGRIFIEIFFSFLAIFALLISLDNPLSRDIKREKNFNLSILLLFLCGIGAIFPYFGLRIQIESWFLLAFLLRVILDMNTWIKYKWFLPAFFVLWVNLHASFSIGLFTMAAVLIVRSIRLKKFALDDFGILVFSFLVTYFNPYGFRIWHEVWQTATDSALRWRVQEWQPVIFNASIFFPIFFTLSVFLLWLTRKAIFLEEKFIYLIYLFLAISSTRQFPLWVIVSLPLMRYANLRLREKVSKIKYGLERYTKFTLIFFLFCLIVFAVFGAGTIVLAKGLTEDNFYPKNAVVFLKEHSPEGNVFSDYNWGGYLIWKYPAKKVFVDGRMPSWRWDANLKDESNNAMQDFIDITNKKGAYKAAFNKYNIRTVLLPKKNIQSSKLNILSKLKNFYQNLLKENSSPSLVDSLKADGWKIVYEDTNSIILQK